MEDGGQLGSFAGKSLLIPRSDRKVTAGKRSSEELGEETEVAQKRVKMRALDSLCQPEDMNTNHSKSLRNKEVRDQFHTHEKEMSRVTEVSLTSGPSFCQVEKAGGNPPTLDLNSKFGVGNPNPMENIERSQLEDNCASSVRIGLDLNAEDVASSVNIDQFYRYKCQNHVKSRDISECGSSTGPLEEKDSMRLWREMKQNGFLSSSHGGIPVQNSFFSSSSHGGIMPPPMPKQRGRKSKSSDVYKKRMELAKRENIDRFTKIAAPSGLLNELNPGIINNVRNRKQVYSIIEAIVRSEKHDKHSLRSDKHDKHSCQMRGEACLGSMNDSRDDRIPHTFPFGMAVRGHSMPIVKSCSAISEEKSVDGDSSNVDCEDDALALKLSSSTKASENVSTLSNEESANFTSASSLSVKAATVASQWLELLHQDIKGRLAALRRSRKRVRSVITTELPFLISKEFSTSPENDPNVSHNSVDGFLENANARMHRERWNSLFDQMDKALTEEEKQLESWLNQVKEMQLHCDQGLQHLHWNYNFQPPGTSANDFRLGLAADRELAVKAAAASIYSTCNFLSSKENVSCC